MLTEIDIYCSTNVLLKRHGPDAPIHAAMRADELLEAGDLDGYAVWKRVVKEVEQFQREEPTSQLLAGDRAVALRRRSPERKLAGLLNGRMGSAFVCIAPLLVSCSTGSAPTSLRRR